jgi:hypothetical protein
MPSALEGRTKNHHSQDLFIVMKGIDLCCSKPGSINAFQLFEGIEHTSSSDIKIQPFRGLGHTPFEGRNLHIGGRRIKSRERRR